MINCKPMNIEKNINTQNPNWLRILAFGTNVTQPQVRRPAVRENSTEFVVMP